MRRALRWLGLALIAWLAVLSFRIVDAGRLRPPGRADAAIVLGAAVQGNQPSPVFRERILHGIALYRAGRVRMLIMTGGYGDGKSHAEATVARRVAILNGVPASAIAVETRSRTTRQNLAEAARLMRTHRLSSALVVSDPFHILRALRMGRDLGLAVEGAPTPTTRYRSWHTKAEFLLHELYFMHVYWATGR